MDSIRRRLPELLAGPWRFPPRPPGAGEEHKLSAREQESLDKKLEEIGIIGELREKSVKRFVEWAQKFVSRIEPLLKMGFDADAFILICRRTWNRIR